MKDLELEYKKESGYDVGKIRDVGITYFSDDYVEWLERKVKEIEREVCSCGSTDYFAEQHKDIVKYYCMECYEMIKN